MPSWWQPQIAKLAVAAQQVGILSLRKFPPGAVTKKELPPPCRQIQLSSDGLQDSLSRSSAKRHLEVVLKAVGDARRFPASVHCNKKRQQLALCMPSTVLLLTPCCVATAFTRSKKSSRPHFPGTSITLTIRLGIQHKQEVHTSHFCL